MYTVRNLQKFIHKLMVKSTHILEYTAQHIYKTETHTVTCVAFTGSADIPKL